MSVRVSRRRQAQCIGSRPTDDAASSRVKNRELFFGLDLSLDPGSVKPGKYRGDFTMRDKNSDKSAKFSDLSSEQQIALLKKIEKTPFFNLVRTHTVMGCFCDPEYGGNFNGVGWKLIGFEDRFNFKPPFGYYDREFSEAQ